MSRRIVVLVIVFLMTLAADANARKRRQIVFRGWHPVPVQAGGRFCFVDGVHKHDFRAAPGVVYQKVRGAFVFVGDPKPFRYEGQRFAFYGHHPIPDAGKRTWCYLEGRHDHVFPVPQAGQYTMIDGAAWYGGKFDAVYKREKSRRSAQLASFYRRASAKSRSQVIAAAPVAPAAPAATAAPVAPAVAAAPAPAVAAAPVIAAPRRVVPKSPPANGEFVPREDND